MPDPGGSTFAPAPVVPGRGRPPWLAAGLVVAVVVGSIVIARLTPVPEPVRPVPSAVAEASVAPAPPTEPPALAAAALPLREWFSGSAAPIDDLLVDAGGVRWLRLAGARLSDLVLTRSADDLLLQTARDETTCLCWQSPSRRLRRSGNEAGDPRVLELVRADVDAGVQSRSIVTVVDGFDPDAGDASSTRVALAASPDQRSAYLVREMRTATSWSVHLDLIDLRTGAVLDTIPLWSATVTALDTGDPIGPPTLRIAHDGRHALVATTRVGGRVGEPSGPVGQAWIVTLEGSSIGPAVAVDAIAARPLADCGWIDFVRSRRLIAGCMPADDDGTSAFEVRRFTLAGRELATLNLPPHSPRLDPPLIDTEHGIAYTWDPVQQRLGSVDLLTGDARSSGARTADETLPDEVVIRGPRPDPGTPTSWSRGLPATAAIAQPAMQTLVGSPDGSLLFAIGHGLEPGSTSGVWVFDARTLRLLERWPALTSYTSISLFEGGRWFDGGRWLAAIGRSGVTADGDPADWDMSVTILDTTTGRPILRLGDLGTDAPITFPGVALR